MSKDSSNADEPAMMIPSAEGIAPAGSRRKSPTLIWSVGIFVTGALSRYSPKFDAPSGFSISVRSST